MFSRAIGMEIIFTVIKVIFLLLLSFIKLKFIIKKLQSLKYS